MSAKKGLGWVLAYLGASIAGWLVGAPVMLPLQREVPETPSVKEAQISGDRLSQLSTQDILTQLDHPPPGWLAAEWRNLLRSLLAERDPSEAILLGEADQRVVARAMLLNDPLSVWLEEDRSNQDPKKYQHILEALSKADPDTFVSLTQNSEIPLTGHIEWDRVYKYLFKKSPEAALSYFQARSDRRATGYFVGAWSELDPSAAWTWLESSGLAERQLQSQILASWLTRDFIQASEKVVAMKSSDSSLTPFIAQALIQFPPEQAGPMYEQHLGKRSANQRAEIAVAMAYRDAGKAIALIEGFSEEHREDTALRFLSEAPTNNIALLSQWITSDTLAPIATEAADQLAKNLVLARQATEWKSVSSTLNSDHPLAIALEHAHDAIEAALTDNPQPFAEWVAREPSAELLELKLLVELKDAGPTQELDFLAVTNLGRHGYLSNALERLSLTDLETATAWTTNQTNVDIQGTAVRAISGRLAKLDPALALEWASQLGSPPLESIATEETLSNWNRSDPEAAAAWIANHPEQTK